MQRSGFMWLYVAGIWMSRLVYKFSGHLMLMRCGGVVIISDVNLYRSPSTVVQRSTGHAIPHARSVLFG